MLLKDPIYKQLADNLRQEIIDGKFVCGDKFYSERELVEEYNVSRVTVNKAVSILIAEGYVENKKGKGSFVKESPTQFNMNQLISISQMVKAMGKVISTEVISFEEVTLNKFPVEIPIEMVDDGVDEFYSLKRVRLIDGRPMVLDRRVIVKSSCPGFERSMIEGSSYDGLEKLAGKRIEVCDQLIHAVTVTKEEADCLGVEEGDACLLLNAKVYLEGGVPLWYESSLFNGNNFMFSNHFNANDMAGPATKLFVQK